MCKKYTFWHPGYHDNTLPRLPHTDTTSWSVFGWTHKRSRRRSHTAACSQASPVAAAGYSEQLETHLPSAPHEYAQYRNTRRRISLMDPGFSFREGEREKKTRGEKERRERERRKGGKEGEREGERTEGGRERERRWEKGGREGGRERGREKERDGKERERRKREKGGRQEGKYKPRI